MEDMYYSSRNIEMIKGLHESMQHKVWEAIDAIELVGEDFLITDGYRSEKEQNELYEQGRTRPGKIVTHVRGGYSLHNHGLAIDIVPVSVFGLAMGHTDRSQKSSIQAVLEWSATHRYNNYGRILQEAGLSWGFQLWGFDRPHFHYVTTERGIHLDIDQIRHGVFPSVERARAERREALIERIELAERALPKKWITKERKRALTRFIEQKRAILSEI